jgi:DNA-directed RNA polymerase specialized sigma subunit
MTNEEAFKLAKEFQTTGNSKTFELLWSSTCNLAEPYKYFDPTGARDYEDFLQLTRIGLYQAIESYKPDKGSTFLSWARMRMTQLLIKELRGITRASRLGYKISLDTVTIGGEERDSSTIEHLIYKQLVASDSYQAASVEWSDDLYWKIIYDIEEKINHNRSISRVFWTKIAFPNISRESISTMLNLSKPTISQHFEIIRNCISRATDKYAF